MIKTYIILVLFIFTAANAAEQKKSFEDYKTIAKKNIFSRQRIGVKAKEDDTAKKEEKKFVLEAFILRGTAINDNDKIAFVENVFDNQIYHIKVNEEFEGSIINDISSDRITIVKDAVVSDVFVGGQFSGDKKVEDNGESSKAQPVESKTGSAAAGGGLTDIEKQMIERRKKQLGK